MTSAHPSIQPQDRTGLDAPTFAHLVDTTLLDTFDFYFWVRAFFLQVRENTCNMLGRERMLGTSFSWHNNMTIENISCVLMEIRFIDCHIT